MFDLKVIFSIFATFCGMAFGMRIFRRSSPIISKSVAKALRQHIMVKIFSLTGINWLILTKRMPVQKSKKASPPIAASFLIDAVPPKKRNELLGHYYETCEYDQWVEKYGQKWADRLFWFRVSCLCVHLMVGILTSSILKRIIGK